MPPQEGIIPPTVLPAPPVAVWESELPDAAEVARLMTRLGRPPADPSGAGQESERAVSAAGELAGTLRLLAAAEESVHRAAVTAVAESAASCQTCRPAKQAPSQVYRSVDQRNKHRLGAKPADLQRVLTCLRTCGIRTRDSDGIRAV